MGKRAEVSKCRVIVAAIVARAHPSRYNAGLVASALRFSAYSLPSYHAELDGPPGPFMRNTVNLLASAEPLGFDGIWLNEHHFHPWGGMIPSPPIMLSALAQRTQRVTLGTSIVVLPLHNPIQVAEEVAMLDLMSKGRVQLGVGRGSLAVDYEDMGLSYGDAQERLIDGLELMLKGFQGQRFSHDGPFYKVDGIEIWPPVVQKPHPPVWISCSNNPASFEWTAKRGYNLLTIAFPKPVDKLAALTRVYRDAWQQPAPYEIGTLYHTVVAESSARARELATGAFRNFYYELHAARRGHATPLFSSIQDLDVDTIIEDRRLVAGNPEEVAAMLTSLQGEIGFTQAILMFQLGGLSFDVARESMELFSAEVMPRLRS